MPLRTRECLPERFDSAHHPRGVGDRSNIRIVTGCSTLYPGEQNIMYQINTIQTPSKSTSTPKQKKHFTILHPVLQLLSIWQSVSHLISLSVSSSIKQSINQSINQSISSSVSLFVSRSSISQFVSSFFFVRPGIAWHSQRHSPWNSSVCSVDFR